MPRLSKKKCLRAAVAALAALLSPSLATAQYTGNATPEAFAGQIQTAAASDVHEVAALPDLGNVPASYQPWWQDVLTAPMRPDSNTAAVGVETLLVRTLNHSAQVKVFSDLPLIRQTAITEACAAFDWNAFMNTRWDDTSDPVGNVLTTGGADRYQNNQWTGTAGLGRRNYYGGRVEIAQDLGHQNTNSTFFQPNNQGTSRLRLSYVQPLMQGRGRVYNQSLIVLAKIDTSIAKDEFSRQLQSHLLEVTRAYWAFYLERAALVQKRRLLERAESIQTSLQARSGVDIVGSQLTRVNAAVTNRRADLVRAEMAVRNAQDRIQALVNDPEFGMTYNLEMVPTDLPIRYSTNMEVGDVLSTAMQKRPEVEQAIKQIKAACVRLGMSKNELLPQFDFIAETYVAGLRGRSDIGRAWTDQFETGEPSYAVGFAYQMPIGNRIAKARLQRRQLEVRQLQNQFNATVETLLMETKVAIREVRTSEQEFQANYIAMQAAEARLDNIEQRWNHLPGQDGSIGLYLEDLLDAQSQLTAAEFEFTRALTTYNLSLMNLKRASGTLLEAEQVSEGCADICGLPTKILDKPVLDSSGAINTSYDAMEHDFAPKQHQPYGTPTSEMMSPVHVSPQMIEQDALDF